MRAVYDNLARLAATNADTELQPARSAANENVDAQGVNAVLDVDDVALLLRVGRNTIYELVARNQIPHRRLLKQIRFSRAAIMRWLDSCGRSQDAQQGH